jgi:hypothetical protein
MHAATQTLAAARGGGVRIEVPGVAGAAKLGHAVLGANSRKCYLTMQLLNALIARLQ